MNLAAFAWRPAKGHALFELIMVRLRVEALAFKCPFAAFELF